MKKLSVGSYNRAFETPGCSGWEWLTRDDEVVRAYVEDEMCGFDFTAAGYRDLFRLLGTVQRRAWSSVCRMTYPYCLSAERLTPSVKTAEESSAWRRGSDVPDVRMSR